MRGCSTNDFRGNVKRCAILLIVAVLLGCASQEAFRHGKELLETGKPEEGLMQLKQAMHEQPDNIEYRSYYYRQREIWVNRLLRETDTARVNRHWEDADNIYKRILDIDSDNQRAQDGLRDVTSGKRRELAFQEAGDLFIKGELDAASEKIRLVLAENTSDTEVRALASRIEQKRAAAATPAMQLAKKFRKPISLELKDAPVKTVFELLSKAAGINFILDRDLRADLRVSVFVKHTTIEAALQNIFASSQLGKKVLDENSVLIFPLTKKADYEEIVVRTFYLNNVDPKQVMSLLKTVIKAKDIFVDDKLNILVMRDTFDTVKQAEKLIASYDLGDPEVLLEVEVLEVSRNKLLDIGVKYPNQLSVGVNGTPGPGQLTFKDVKNFTSGMGIVTINDPTLVLNLQATDSDSKLLANPRIRVKNHKKAKIHIGDRVPVITTTATTIALSESVNYLDVGLKLEVEPSVMVADEVSIDVGLEVSNIVNEVISKSGTLTYRIGTRNANTTLRLKNGETQMLAGLINDEERSSSNRVPGLSSLPIIGRLFASKKDNHDKTEIVLLITPRIVRNIVPPDASLVEFSVGTESGNVVSGRSSATGDSSLLPMDNSLQAESLQPQPMETLQPMVDNQQQVLSPSALAIPPPPPLPNAEVPQNP